MRENNYNKTLLVGISIFAYLVISTLCYTFDMILKDLLILLEIKPTLNIIFSNISNFILFFILISILFIKAKNVYFPSITIFNRLFVVFFSFQLFQFFYTYYFQNYLINNYGSIIDEYYEEVQNLKIKYIFGVTIDFLKYIVLTVYIYLYLKKIKASN